MTASLIKFIHQSCQPIEPRPTGVEPNLDRLSGIRAVLFDIYGTLLISDSGDVGGRTAETKQAAWQKVAAIHDITTSASPSQVIEVFEATIRETHEISRNTGIEHPEVDIIEIWRSTIEKINGEASCPIEWQRFALEFEVLVNPVWPMPDLISTLETIRTIGPVLGIVSNAQFFTPLLFPALVDHSLAELGFRDELSFFSYAHGHAKPGPYLYELAKQALKNRSIKASEVLYVGNDMLNDIAAAETVGFQTALFAGDQRSLRWRRDDMRVQGITPKTVVTQLSQLIDILRDD